MAKGLRSRPVTSRPVTAAVGARLRLPHRTGPTTTCIALIVTLFAACERHEPAAAASHVDVAQIAPDQLVAAILDECHRPLRGRMDSVSATVTFADDRIVRLFAELPGRVRVQGDDGLLLLRDQQVHRLDDRPLTDRDQANVRSLARMLDAAAFGPLRRANRCERIDTHHYRLTGDGDRVWQLQLRPNSLLPASLSTDAGPHGESQQRVTFDGYLRTKTTWVVNAATTDQLGACRLRFDDGGITWEPDFFAADARTGNREGSQRMVLPGSVVETRSATPIVVDSKATSWVVLEDPGSWPERVTAYREVHEELVRQNQRIAGFPPFWFEPTGPRLAAPFRRRPDGQALTAPDGWRIRNLPAGRWLVVYPPEGDLEQRIATGTEQLTTALREQGLTAAGPIVAQPFLHLHEGEPSTEKLAAPVVRCAVAIE